jgi:hypothetical protein
MAVEFISNGYDTTTTNPYTEGAWADAHPVIGLAKYAVRSPLDWKVTAVAGQDRTVSIAAGSGVGHGVTDKTVANDTIQLDSVGSGSRWDLIACRRDWTPTAGESEFVKVNGGANATIPGGRQTNPGGIDDQPLALVEVRAGQTELGTIIDLRTWVGDGGGLVANHDLVRSFLNKAGTRLNIAGIDWLRRVGANDTNEWVKLGEAGKHPLFGAGGTLAGGIPAAGTGFLVQAGTSVLTTDNSGFARITFPSPFPNGLLTFIPSNGDMNVDRSKAAALTFGIAGGSPHGTGTKADVVVSVERYNAAPETNTAVRCNWIAIGW